MKYSEIVKYIYNHPELEVYYTPENSYTFLTNWGLRNPFGQGKHYRTDYTLHDKQYIITTHIILEADDSECLYLWSTVTFFTPTHFQIEYLRVQRVGTIPEKMFRIIDGRKDMKYDLNELDNVDLRAFPKYRN